MFESIKRQLAIRAYRERLAPWLRKRYGWRGSYTPRQVSSGVSALGLPSDDLRFCYAAFCARSAFDRHFAALGETHDYEAIRAQLPGIESAAGGSGGSSDLGGDSGGVEGDAD